MCWEDIRLAKKKPCEGGCGGLKNARAKFCMACRWKVGKTRVCKRCKRDLPISSFRIRTRKNPKPRSYCKGCESAEQSIRYQKMAPEERKRATRNWEKSNPEKFALQLQRRRWAAIGIKPTDEMFRRGLITTKCEICGRGPRGRHKQLSIDHCHKTGKFRGFLCSCCNLMLGKLNDDPRLFDSAARYLRRCATKM